MSIAIKFGTDGWRAIIAQEFTVDNVARVAYATALHIKKSNVQPSVVIGHDCRFGGELFAETTARVMAAQGVKVWLAKGIVSTPMVSLGCHHLKASIGVVITASHNPASYNGFKLKSTFGGPSSPAEIEAVENLIPDTVSLPQKSIQDFVDSAQIEYIDLETLYFEHVQRNFDMMAINNSGMVFAFDAMYGAGQKIVRRLIPNIVHLHCEQNPSFNGTAPEPLHKNLLEFSELIKHSTDIDFGFANDGDADRIGIYNSAGVFVDSHHIMLLLVHYLHIYKGMTGKVVAAFSVTDKLKKLCEAYNLPLQITKIGFKYICEIMVNEDVLVGGEESGGIAIKGHIPERDGVWNALTLMEFMAKTGKTLEELIQEVYAIVGSFDFDRYDLHITEDLKQSIIENCKNNTYKAFGKYTIQRLEDIDGWKYHLDENSWVMIRASGTEPVLRVYCESSNKEKVIDILESTKAALLS
jgi:phosphomannomutase